MTSGNCFWSIALSGKLNSLTSFSKLFLYDFQCVCVHWKYSTNQPNVSNKEECYAFLSLLLVNSSSVTPCPSQPPSPPPSPPPDYNVLDYSNPIHSISAKAMTYMQFSDTWNFWIQGENTYECTCKEKIITLYFLMYSYKILSIKTEEINVC